MIEKAVFLNPNLHFWLKKEALNSGQPLTKLVHQILNDFKTDKEIKEIKEVVKADNNNK